MLIEATASEFAALIRGHAPRNLRLVADIAPPEVLAMLSDLAASIRAKFAPSAWLIVEGEDIVGLLSLIRAPNSDTITIGYGVAPASRGRGVATRAVTDLLIWAKADPRVGTVEADTAVDNLASQKVLAANDFTRIGERVDPDDGPVITWRRDL
jgi:RimJ/RimL family protein N-acetyltransferase